MDQLLVLSLPNIDIFTGILISIMIFALIMHIIRRRQVNKIWDADELKKEKYLRRPWLALFFISGNILNLMIILNYTNQNVIASIIIILIATIILWRLDWNETFQDFMLTILLIPLLSSLFVFWIGVVYFVLIFFPDLWFFMAAYNTLFLLELIDDPDPDKDYILWAGSIAFISFLIILWIGLTTAPFGCIMFFVIWTTSFLLFISYNKLIILRFACLSLLSLDKISLLEHRGIYFKKLSNIFFFKNIISEIKRNFMFNEKTSEVQLPDNFSVKIERVDDVIKKLMNLKLDITIEDLKKRTGFTEYHILLALGRSKNQLTKSIFDKIKRASIYIPPVSKESKISKRVLRKISYNRFLSLYASFATSFPVIMILLTFVAMRIDFNEHTLFLLPSLIMTLLILYMNSLKPTSAKIPLFSIITYSCVITASSLYWNDFISTFPFVISIITLFIFQSLYIQFLGVNEDQISLLLYLVLFIDVLGLLLSTLLFDPWIIYSYGRVIFSNFFGKKEAALLIILFGSFFGFLVGKYLLKLDISSALPFLIINYDYILMHEKNLPPIILSPLLREFFIRFDKEKYTIEFTDTHRINKKRECIENLLKRKDAIFIEISELLNKCSRNVYDQIALAFILKEYNAVFHKGKIFIVNKSELDLFSIPRVIPLTFLAEKWGVPKEVISLFIERLSIKGIINAEIIGENIIVA